MAGGQAVQADRDAAAAGRDASSAAAGEQSVNEGWKARLRKRGVIATLAINGHWHGVHLDGLEALVVGRAGRKPRPTVAGLAGVR